MAKSIRALFPYPGGKASVVDMCWSAFGADVPGYVELCSGSAAMLFGRPGGGAGRYETINDASGFVANAWRSIKRYPAEVAHHAKGPPCELDLKAYAAALRDAAPILVDQLGKSATWCDPQLAGFWVYGQSLALEPDWVDSRTPTACKGSRKGIFGLTTPPLDGWIQAIAARLRDVLICCGDWSRLVTDTALGFNTTGTWPVAVFADPPYLDESLDYGAEPDVARKVAAWCAEHGDDRRLRIVLAGHVGDYDLPGWRVVNWGGSRGHGRERRGDNECLWFSPHCLGASRQASLFDEVGT